MCVQEQIMKQRSLAAAIVLGHLAKALEDGYFVDYRKAGLTEELEEMITNTIRKEPIFSNIASLRLIKDQLPEEVGYGYIQLTIAILKIRTGYVSANSPSRTPATSNPPPIPPPADVPTSSKLPHQPATGHLSFSSGVMLTTRQNSGRGKKRRLPSPPTDHSRDQKKSKSRMERFW
jgi:hypothetical protein